MEKAIKCDGVTRISFDENGLLIECRMAHIPAVITSVMPEKANKMNCNNCQYKTDLMGVRATNATLSILVETILSLAVSRGFSDASLVESIGKLCVKYIKDGYLAPE